MTGHDTALEAAAKLSASLRERTQLRFSGNCKCGQCMLVPLETITVSADALDFLAEKLRAYSLSPDVSGLVERLRRYARNHEKGFPQTMLYTREHQAVDNEAADALTALSLQLEASERLRKAAEEDSKRILDINTKHCEAVNTYIILNARLQERADALEAQLADKWEVISSADREALRVVTEENERLRKIISDSAEALGNGAFIAPTCSIDFMSGLPNEIKLHVATLSTPSKGKDKTDE